jgi:heterodisulfide reductase subunit B
MNRISYFPGCSQIGTSKEYDISTRAIFNFLEIELVDVPDWNCCGATSAHSTSFFLSIALPARNLFIAQDIGLDLTTPCAACFNRLKVADYEIKKNEKVKKDMQEFFKKEYKGINVEPILGVFCKDEILNKIKDAIVKPLKGINVAPYYGCLILRPPNIVQFDDCENPKSLNKIINVLGGECINFAYKTECCGASLTLTKSEIVLKLINDILKDAKDRYADCIVTCCPFCHFNLDAKQRDVEKKYKTKYNIPIFHFTQLIGICLGLNKKELGYDKHFVPTYKILNSLG